MLRIMFMFIGRLAKQDFSFQKHWMKYLKYKQELVKLCLYPV